MRLYEAMYIVRPDVEDDDLTAVMNRVRDTIIQIGGTIDLHEVWDRRDLIFEIDECLRGTYCICYFNAEDDAVDGLRRELGLDEQVLRHMVVVPNPAAMWSPPAPEPPPQEAETATSPDGETPAEQPTEPKTDEPPAETPAEATTEPEPPADEPPAQAETEPETPADAPADGTDATPS